ncbi:MAG: hypothetical protein AAFZ46_12100 [Pseudomonadota bacterium]
MSHWASLTYSNTASFGERIFVNLPWRAGGARSNRLTAWITPVIGQEDTAGAWRFHAKSGSQDLPDHQTAELLAGVFTLMAGHGFQAEKTSFATLSTLAQHPHHHIPEAHRLAAERHIARQRRGELVKVQRTPVFTL